MKITYDPEADALQILLRPNAVFENSLDIEEGVTADLDADGHIVGLEILDASERIGPDPLAQLTVERYPSTQPVRGNRRPVKVHR